MLHDTTWKEIDVKAAGGCSAFPVLHSSTSTVLGVWKQDPTEKDRSTSLQPTKEASTVITERYVPGPYAARQNKMDFIHQLHPTTVYSIENRDLSVEHNTHSAMQRLPGSGPVEKVDWTSASEDRTFNDFWPRMKSLKLEDDMCPQLETALDTSIAIAEHSSSDETRFRGLVQAAVQKQDPSRMCKFWMQGYCSRGNKCSFVHSPEAARRNGSEVNRFSGVPFEQLRGDLYFLSKDQHGCRYLQKCLEEPSSEALSAIHAEIAPHFVELMTDPFGNYLCQKLLDTSTESQCSEIVDQIREEILEIATNIHGTRAVQKLIQHLSPKELHKIVSRIEEEVIYLIQDLNGNHVIQKCLNCLSPERTQFIYDAVTDNLVAVATHRHGCCVLQRCFDHGTSAQRQQLIQAVLSHAIELVQDPFGNYVIQYILDFGDETSTNLVVQQFVGHVTHLAMQKFASNVIEKCIRVAPYALRKELIEELINRSKLERLLRDSYANYVVQTALELADPIQRLKLVDCIQPVLPMIKGTPHHKRIQCKLYQYWHGARHDTVKPHLPFNQLNLPPLTPDITRKPLSTYPSTQISSNDLFAYQSNLSFLTFDPTIVRAGSAGYSKV